MLKAKERDIAEIKNRTKLAKSYTEFMKVYHPMVEKIQEAKGELLSYLLLFGNWNLTFFSFLF